MKLKTITNGPRWMRYPFFIVFMINILNLVTGQGNPTTNLISAAILGGLVFLLWKYRNVKYDDQNIYFISGGKKTIVPFEFFTELRRSKSKLNGNRFWILKYKDKEGRIKTRRFFHGIFQGGPKEFHAAIRKIHPMRIEYTTNYSQMVDSWDEMNEKKRKKKKSKEKLE